MARMFKAKSGRNPDAGARPGAARVLPMRLVAKVPLLRRFAPKPPPARQPGLLSPRRLVGLLSGRKPTPPPPSRLPVAIVGPMIRGVRQPIERTAAVVRAARDVRKPQTRWERLREAARVALDDPVDGTRWERLMGLGVGLVAGGPRGKTPKKTQASGRLPRLRVTRPKAETPGVRPAAGLRGSLRRLQVLLNENAGPGQRRDRRGIEPPKAR